MRLASSSLPIKKDKSNPSAKAQNSPPRTDLTTRRNVLDVVEYVVEMISKEKDGLSDLSIQIEIIRK